MVESAERTEDDVMEESVAEEAVEPEDVPEDAPEDAPEDVPEDAPEDVQEDMVEEPTEEVADDNGAVDMGEDYGPSDDDSSDTSFWNRKRRQTDAIAAQPLEVGVVHTKYGTVAAGPVLAGIAAGSEPQSAPVRTSPT